jgi:multiple sugar transport system substrate-binding protein
MDQPTSLSRRTFLAGAAATGAVLASESLLPIESHAARPGAAVEVVEWHSWGGDSKTYEENRIKQFNATHPDIHVTPLYVPDIPTKLLPAIAGGNPPDLVTADPTVLGYQGGLTDLTPYMRTLGWNPNQMLPGALPFMAYNNKIWAVCELGSLIFLYINKALFRQAGLDPNKPPTNLAQLDAYAEKLTTYDSKGNFKTIGFIPWAEDGSGYWGVWLWQWLFGANFTKKVNGKLMLTLTDPAAIRALNWEAGYGKKYGASKLSGVVTGAAAPFSIDDLFISGKMAMMIGGQWHTEAMRTYNPKLDYAAYAIPAPPGGRQNATILSFNTWVVPQGARHPLEALKYGMWAGNGAPVVGNENTWMTVSAYKQPANAAKNIWQQRKDPVYSLVEKLAGSSNATKGPLLPISAQLNDAMTTAEQSVYYGKANAEQALSQVQSRMQPMLDKALNQ